MSNWTSAGYGSVMNVPVVNTPKASVSSAPMGGGSDGARPKKPKYTAAQLAALRAKGHTLPGGTRVPIADAEDLDKAIQMAAVAGSGPIRRHIMRRAKALGMMSKIPATWAADGTVKGGGRAAALGDLAVRTVDYDTAQLAVRADVEGRTVVAYAAVFDPVQAEINDQDGRYYESISRDAFNKTVRERRGHISALYNHGKTLFGTPSERGSLPIGAPLDIRPDAKGLLTVTRFNDSALANDLLASIRNGDPLGLSFAGRFVRSERTRGVGGGLDRIVRHEVAMREYSFSPTPAYKEAVIVGVRAAGDDVDDDAALHSASARRARLTAARIR